MERSLEGKVALLTGCASGIGAATVPVLLREGAVVVATDIDQNRGENLVRKLDELHPNRVIFQAHDVTDETSWKQAINVAQDRYGGIDVIINNAGVLPALLALEETTLEEWRRVMAINLDGVFLGVKQVFAA